MQVAIQYVGHYYTYINNLHVLKFTLFPPLEPLFVLLTPSIEIGAVLCPVLGSFRIKKKKICESYIFFETK